MVYGSVGLSDYHAQQCWLKDKGHACIVHAVMILEPHSPRILMAMPDPHPFAHAYHCFFFFFQGQPHTKQKKKDTGSYWYRVVTITVIVVQGCHVAGFGWNEAHARQRSSGARQ